MHFVGVTSALARIFRTLSLKTHLSVIAGRVWFEVCGLELDYRVNYA